MQPLSRTTNVQATVVGGYVTTRLQVIGEPVTAESGYVDNTTMVVLENVGAQAASVRLQGCNDYSSGPREWVGAQQTVVPLGRTSYSVTPRHTYLEVKGISDTTAMRMQFTSRLKWNELGFDKTDPFYPQTLVNAKNPLTSAV